ncbi:MAG TPA: hypothetical protein VN256_10670 [Pyrinomonadaceae bacterium]|nr:hypothetical protein [Pyrinomonadaceae bacterium]
MDEALNLPGGQSLRSAAAQAENSLAIPAAVVEFPAEVSAGGKRDDEARAIPLIARLCRELAERKVSYCHWKSNWKLDEWLTGEGDLDLLIDRSDAAAFTSVIAGLGFKQAQPTRDRDVPGVLNFYGLDSQAGRFVHLHVHYQLILGHDLTKNYRLPIEKPYLESAAGSDSLLPTPAPEFEFVVYVLRMVLKYTAAETLLRRARGHSPSSAVRKELEQLEAKSDRAAVLAVLEEHLPLIDAAFFGACVESLRAGRAGSERAAVKRELRRRLRAHGRRAQLADTLLKPARQASRIVRERVFKKSSRKQLTNGGAIVALVGGDGSGKTTSARELSRWLSKKFVVRRFHVGKPPRSVLTLAVIVALRIRRGLSKSYASNLEALKHGGAHTFPGYLQLLRWVCAGRDRRRLYTKARRFATNGGICVCDRYPVPQIQLMDGPNIGRAVEAGRMNRLVKFLLRAEERCYAEIMPPDVLVVLRLDPEAAVRRKTEESELHVRSRSRELWEVDWSGTRANVVDAGQPLETVRAEIQALVWEHL